MKTLRTLMATVGLLLALVIPSFAQTTINSTTLAAAVTSANASSFQLASTSNVSVGDLLAVVTGSVVREFVTVRAVASPYVTVTRDSVGLNPERKARLHPSGSTVYTGAKSRFYSYDVSGSCTAAAEQFLPHFSTTSGLISQCNAGGVWYRLDQVFTVNCRALLVADMVDQSCFIADSNYLLVGITEVHAVKETGGTLTLVPRKQTTTQAPASGTALATALDMAAAATAETVRSATLSATGSALLIASGNRLGLDFTDDVAGELAGVTVTFSLAPR